MTTPTTFDFRDAKSVVNRRGPKQLDQLPPDLLTLPADGGRLRDDGLPLYPSCMLHVARRRPEWMREEPLLAAWLTHPVTFGRENARGCYPEAWQLNRALAWLLRRGLLVESEGRVRVR